MSAVPERVVQVGAASRQYPVYIASHALDRLGERLREHVSTNRVAVVTDDNVGPLYAEPALATLRDARFEPRLLTVPAGEESKSLARVSALYDGLAAARIGRDVPVIALGGGVVGDLTGFAAATWQRGVPFVQCPTTLEADVDSSVGGKTGVNHASGKNMIGAFYQPLFVLIDTDTLRTLSGRDFKAGLAESVKHAVIRDPEFFLFHEHFLNLILTHDPEAMGQLIERNVQIKAAVVAQDERETTGMRALLNFGHTIGHAIEAAMAKQGDSWRHGECVAAGMAAACEMSVVSGRLDRAIADRIVSLLERIGLPTQAPLARARTELMQYINADKKAAGGNLRFVLAEAIGRARLYDDIQPAWIEAALRRVCV
jgi:3-dehydroquinate synthase